MKSVDTPAHTQGHSPFTDDLPEPVGLLFAAVCPSPVSRGTNLKIDISEAEKRPGVVRVFTVADIPGENEVGGIIHDEPLLAQHAVHYVGQPVALVVAETARAARLGATRVRMIIDEQTPVFDAYEAVQNGDLIVPPRTLALGDVDEAWADCTTVVEGRVVSGGQEHLYLETQAALCVPEERNRLKVYSATQAPTLVQRIVGRVLDKPMHDIEVDVARLGGAFGGKEDQATHWAVLAALAANALQRPVKMVLQRHEDMRMTGKRHPYVSDFKIGLDEALKIRAYEATYYQNGGACADLSTAVMERTLFHGTNSYFIPNVRVTGYSGRTNLPPFTAFRGFGAPQSMFVMESAIASAAEQLGIAAWEIQQRNLLQDGDRFPYGMPVQRSQAPRSFEEVVAWVDLAARKQGVDRFNAGHVLRKKGLAVMPVCFGISFTKTFLNQAGALVHVYTDGSVGVSTGAVEMGQGVNTKIRGVVARTLGIPETRVRVEQTNTTRVANTSPTAASTGTDLNGMAAHLACNAILARLKNVAAEYLEANENTLVFQEGHVTSGSSGMTWPALVSEAYFRRISLSAQALYATPRLTYDLEQEKGTPFAYHVFGAAVVEVTVDVLRGTYTIDAVHMVHDAGKSLAPLIDRGQVEGGLLQGLGWMTIEELVHNERGALLSDSLTTYKIPDLHFTPKRVEVMFLEDADNPDAIMGSKAIGEPPLMYGIGAYFAIRNALKAAHPNRPMAFHAPLTHERVLAFLDPE